MGVGVEIPREGPREHLAAVALVVYPIVVIVQVERD
jgi:hypothetical protein